MPFVTRTPTPQPALVNPRPRQRGVAVAPNPISSDPVVNEDEPAPTASPNKKSKQEKRQPKGDYECGYCRTKEETRFKIGNPGGPGRPKKDSKSQDELMREELLRTRMITEGGRRRRVTKRALIPMLLVNKSLEKSSTKDLRELHETACHLFPERPTDATPAVVHDPLADLEYLRTALASTQIGEPDGGGGDALSGIVTSVLDAHAEEGDEAWNEGDWDEETEEQIHDAA